MTFLVGVSARVDVAEQVRETGGALRPAVDLKIQSSFKSHLLPNNELVHNNITK